MKPKIRTAAFERHAPLPPAAAPAPAAAVSLRDLRVARRIGQAFGVLPAPAKPQRGWGED